MNKFICVLVLLISTSASAEICSLREDASALKVGLFVGAAAGVTLGIAAMSTVPVAVAGAPAAIIYFTSSAGLPALKTWIVSSVIPAAIGMGAVGAATGGIIAIGGLEQKCK